MRKDLLPKFFYNLDIRGFEDETDEQKAAREAAEAAAESEEEESEEEDNKDKTENNDALKSALQKERAARKKAERENKALAKFREDAESRDKSETDRAKDEASKAASKAQKLAERLRETAVDNAIIKAGGKLKFRDIDDALKLVDRGIIEVEQDDDDPSEVILDEGSVKSALEILAKAKPHLIIAEGQEEKSGSKFGGSRKSQQDMDEEELKHRYPALNRSIHTS